MSAHPFQPQPSADRPLERADLEPFVRSELDRLYWKPYEPITVAEIAARFDLPANRLCRLVTPFSTDRTCLLCGAGAVCTSRTQRSAGSATCSGCGAAVPAPDRYGRYHRYGEYPALTDDLLLADVDPLPVPHVMVRRRNNQLADLSSDAHCAVDALGRAGRPFEAGRTVVVLEPHDGIEEIQNLLAGHPVSTLGVASLRTLGDSQVEAIQNLMYLTHDGWRVVSASDTHAWVGREDGQWHDDEPGWPRPDIPGSYWDASAARCDDRVIDATHRFRSGW